MRYNENGKLISLVHGRIAAMRLAPSELKPFYHYYPGLLWLSIGTLGCNLKCPGCQNWHLSQSPAHPGLLSTDSMTAKRVAEIADLAHCAGISFTYNEPTVWLEYTAECSKAAKERNLLSTYVSNGMMSDKALDSLIGNVSAFRFDIKGFSEKSYNFMPNPSDWKQVLRNSKAVFESNTHLELVTNIIPGLNDDTTELQDLAEWIKSELGAEVPWHLTKFHPSHKFVYVEPTPLQTLERIRNIAMESGLQYVYIGNEPGHPAESTYCPSCKSKVIGREGMAITSTQIESGSCKKCGYHINVIGAPELTDDYEVD